MLTPNERDVLEYGDFVASWIGGDGKKYCTHDPEVVRRRVRYGHTEWVIPPPAELLKQE